MNFKSKTFSGYKEQCIEPMGMLICPHCGHGHQSILAVNDILVCKRCKNEMKQDELMGKEIPVLNFVCNECGEKIPCTDENLCFGFGKSYLCPRCLNIVAVEYDQTIFQPGHILTLDFNPIINNNAMKVKENIYIAICKTEKDNYVLEFLQFMAKQEESNFLYLKEKHQKACLLFDVLTNHYLGYLIWTDEKEITLRQIFIIKDQRRKGYAMALIHFWANEIVKKSYAELWIEHPNEKSSALLDKLWSHSAEETMK